jgi:hypothetical protein
MSDIDSLLELIEFMKMLELSDHVRNRLMTEIKPAIWYRIREDSLIAWLKEHPGISL